MPFNSLPSSDFINRENELAYLKRLADLNELDTSNNILLEGARGMGKTEIIKQLYRHVFWEDRNVIPFYYSFRRGTLKATHFVRDYFTRFIRQYLACWKKNPSYIDSMGTPLIKLVPLLASLKLEWMIDLLENHREHMAGGDVYEQLMSAITVPVIAARSAGRPLLVLLDDFHMSVHLYEKEPGDLPGLSSLFEGPMKTSLCPHILTGSPEGVLEGIFTDDAFRGKAERVFLGELPEHDAYAHFLTLCEKFRLNADKEAVRGFMRLLGGNPLYIRNMVKALRKMHKKDITENDLLESYGHEVSEGETAFYWSSVFGEHFRDPSGRRAALELLMYRIRTGDGLPDYDRLSMVLGISPSSLTSAVESLHRAGMMKVGERPGQMRDNVLQDFILGLYMKEIEGKKARHIRETIETKYSSAKSTATSFEMVIPMASDAELVAARAVEQIGRNLKIDPDLIDKIQLALIECCINAMEHSGSYEKKVFLKFGVSSERLEISIESPGRFFDPGQTGEQSTEEKLGAGTKRGWGLTLMRKIMDEVRVERIDERTRVILVKKIKPDEVLK
jgi:anti-sigma regulatory factor (Ser/Thr protein kinase)